jgi:hypothetical protein
MRWAGQVAQKVEKRNVYRLSGGKPDRKKETTRKTKTCGWITLG